MLRPHTMPNGKLSAPPEKRRSQAHFAALVNSSSDVIISKSLDGTVLSWNAAAERLFGYTADEMVGQSVRRLIPVELQGEEDEILARISRGEIVGKFETLRRHKDGHTVPIALTVSPIRGPDGAIVGASKIGHDLRQEVEQRKRLKGSDSRFRMLADNIDQLAWIADASGWIGWYNKRWFDFTGTTLSDMEGWGWQAVHHPDHVKRVTQRFAGCIESGEAWEDTFPLRGKDGNYRWFLSRAHPVRDHQGDVLYWFGTNTDVTQQREHEKQIELLMGEVNHRAKNMLALVQAILHRTAGNIDEEFVEGFEKRIAALSANQDLLIRRGWAGAQIGDIVRSQLATLEDYIGDRIDISGPEGMMLAPSAAEALGLAIHELATNALKYGALSNDSGRLLIDWQAGGTDEDRRFRFQWRETGGPPVKTPGKPGFGTVLITRNPKSALGGDVTLDYRRSGLVWKVDAPLDRVIA
jgi:PAS domain S-box-containing protein